jgi:hypothetical protein
MFLGSGRAVTSESRDTPGHRYLAFLNAPEMRHKLWECNVKCVTIHCIHFRIGSPPTEKI